MLKFHIIYADLLAIMATVVTYLQALVKHKGSDLHLSAGSLPMIRVNGEMIPLSKEPLTAAQAESILMDVMSSSQKDDFKKKKSADFALKVKGAGIFRANTFLQRLGMAGVFRALSDKAPTMEELGLPMACYKGASYHNGLFLVTGPTGSGKSTTLASIIHEINRTRRGHILTLEDPIEFQHRSIKGMVNQRQLGDHFTSFSSALKAALREDPDVILVGEMRDPETIALAITAAETGHLVFATLHTNSAAKAVDRILDSFSADEQSQIRSMLSESLRVIVAQKLLKTADGKGRKAYHDILVANAAVANLIREGKTFQIPSMMQTGKKEGMQLIDQEILAGAQRGEITGQTAWDAANDKSLFAAYAPSDSDLKAA